MFDKNLNSTTFIILVNHALDEARRLMEIEFLQKTHTRLTQPNEMRREGYIDWICKQRRTKSVLLGHSNDANLYKLTIHTHTHPITFYYAYKPQHIPHI